MLLSIIEEHLVLNHSFEVSWSIWSFITFRISCPKQVIETILESKDSISKLLCLHLIDEGIYEGRKPNIKRLKSHIENSSSFGENWLLIYETVVKDWISFEDIEQVFDNEYFGIMKDYGVTFYEKDKQIRPKVLMTKNEFLDIYHMEEVTTEEEQEEEEENWY